LFDKEKMVDRVHLEGGLQLLGHEAYGVNVKEDGHRPVHRNLYVVTFVHGGDELLEDLAIPEGDREACGS
jgi:hypothetical protein